MQAKTGKWIVASMLIAFAALAIHFGSRPQLSNDNAVISSDDPAFRKEKEIVALLAARFDLEESTVRKILDRYKTAHFPPRDPDRHVRPNMDFRKTIEDLSNEYAVKKETVAEMILIYRNWMGDDIRPDAPPAKSGPGDAWEKWDS